MRLPVPRLARTVPAPSILSLRPNVLSTSWQVRLNSQESQPTPATAQSSPSEAQESSPKLLSNYQRLREDLKKAMRERDTKTLNPLKSLLNLHQTTAKEQQLKKKIATLATEQDSFLAPLIHQEIARRKDALQGFREHSRTDLLEKEEYEIVVLEKYLPAGEVSEDEIRAWTVAAFEIMRSEGRGANDPGSMGIGRIIKEVEKLSVGKKREIYDKTAFKRIIAETVRELSDRIDHVTEENVRKFEKRESDELTHPRIQ